MIKICSFTKLPYVIYNGKVFVGASDVPDRVRTDFIRLVGQEEFLTGEYLDNEISNVLQVAGPEWFLGTKLQDRADIVLLQLENEGKL